MEKVSVIIPTFNRFKFLLNTIESVKNQTYKNIEIIVVNDRSSEKEYYEYDWKDIKIIHLEKNTKDIFGYACAGFVRNQGITISSGKYVAFCDDDDIWFSHKIELQINAMKQSGCKMSSTDGLIGQGEFDINKRYKKYNSEYYYDILRNIYNSNGSKLLDNGFPYVWDLKFVNIHNCVICSSVIIEKEILDKIGNFKQVKNGEEDYDCWLKALTYTNSVYVNEICFYYDNNHGYCQNY